MSGKAAKLAAAIPQIEAESKEDAGPILHGVDLRTRLGRRFAQHLANLLCAIPGTARPEQILIARQAASLALSLEGEIAKQTSGKGYDIGVFVTASNALARALETLGIDVSAENEDRPDRVPSLLRIF